MTPPTLMLPLLNSRSITASLLLCMAVFTTSTLSACERAAPKTSADATAPLAEPAEVSPGDDLREQSRGLLAELADRVENIADPTTRNSMRFQLALEQAQAGDTKEAVRQVALIEDPAMRQQAGLTAASFVAAQGDASSVDELLTDISDESLQPMLLRVRLTAHAYAGNTQRASELLQEMHAAGQKLGSNKEFDRASILVRSAEGLLKRDDIDGARNALDDAENLLRSQPTSPITDLLLHSLGMLRIQCGDLDTAAQAASLMSSVDAASILRHRIAIELAGAGNTEAASEVVELVEEPRFRALAMASLGESFAETGDDTAAKVSFEDALASAQSIDDSSRLTDVLCTIALHQHRAGRTRDAKNTLDQAATATPNAPRANKPPILKVAHAFRDIGHPEAADQIAEQLLQADPDPVTGALGQANTLRQIAEVQSDPAAANSTLARAESLIANSSDLPSNVYTLMQIASSHRIVGNDEGAERCIDRARELAMGASTSDEKAAALEMIAQAYAEQGKLDAAIAVLDDLDTTQQQTLALLKIATSLRFAANRADAGMEQ
ncbi:MAG: tetratricopeptide repeat protein [Phycisphaerales bacterium JB065]